jgi:hypothetical protein
VETWHTDTLLNRLCRRSNSTMTSGIGSWSLTWPDGRTERFRDNPVRHLLFVPDPETGEMRPVTKRGQPALRLISQRLSAHAF